MDGWTQDGRTETGQADESITGTQMNGTVNGSTSGQAAGASTDDPAVSGWATADAFIVNEMTMDALSENGLKTNGWTTEPNRAIEGIYDSDAIQLPDLVHQPHVPDIHCMRIQIANIVFVGDAGDEDWVLVDTGMPGSADRIAAAAEERYGEGTRPKAIILTHGHFDHVGALITLLQRWDVPVYAHRREMPYLTGEADYPPGDASVGGGMMAVLSPMFPREGIDLGAHVHPLPGDGTVPGMPSWRWIHTPGHTPGHISLFREADGGMIAGDAFTTVRQESALAVLTQNREIHGPPAYFTTDWNAAWQSVRRLEALHPAWAATGHGIPMEGEALAHGLKELAEHFDEIAIPKRGRYVQ